MKNVLIDLRETLKLSYWFLRRGYPHEAKKAGIAFTIGALVGLIF